MVHDNNGCLCLLCAFAGYLLIIRWMIEARYCLLQAELNVTYTCKKFYGLFTSFSPYLMCI